MQNTKQYIIRSISELINLQFKLNDSVVDKVADDFFDTINNNLIT